MSPGLSKWAPEDSDQVPRASTDSQAYAASWHGSTRPFSVGSDDQLASRAAPYAATTNEDSPLIDALPILSGKLLTSYTSLSSFSREVLFAQANLDTSRSGMLETRSTRSKGVPFGDVMLARIELPAMSGALSFAFASVSSFVDVGLPFGERSSDSGSKRQAPPQMWYEVLRSNADYAQSFVLSVASATSLTGVLDLFGIDAEQYDSEW